MALRLSAEFYHKTLAQFEQFADEPLVFPILMGFLKKAAQSSELLKKARIVISDDDEFRVFFHKTRDNLSPRQAQLIQQQEETIRKKLRS